MCTGMVSLLTLEKGTGLALNLAVRLGSLLLDDNACKKQSGQGAAEWISDRNAILAATSCNHLGLYASGIGASEQDLLLERL